MKSSEIRQSFLRYFESNGHTVVGSSSLVPQDDPTILFTNAGMNQFKESFLGTEKRPYTRATTCQKCVRISGKHNDFENVGVTARHHTFFEMLGNFSFGDYFKPDAIRYAWEFVTKTLGFDKNLLWVTVYEQDEEAAKLWADLTDIKRDRILKYGKKDNFWAMGDTGPCGPCSEIFVYVGDDPKHQSEAEFRKDDGQYLEIWNLVFMQFEGQSDGSVIALPKPSIDTGMGLERVASILQGGRANYDADHIRAIISVCESLSGFKYDGSSYAVRDLRTDKAYARDVAMRVIADHSRAVAFLIGDGVYPSSDGRGYALRRILRRAVRHGRVLNFNQPFLADTCSEVIRLMSDAYPELAERQDTILKVADAEERKFNETIDSGLSLLEREVAKLGKNKFFPGEVAFSLHDTYGFPLDLTQDALKAHGLQVDTAAFERSMNSQRERSREDRKSQQITFTGTKIDTKKTEFLGYDSVLAESEIAQVITEDEGRKSFSRGDRLSLVFRSTPFYAESGGQVGDTGAVTINGAQLRVLDTQKVQGAYWVHECQVVNGELGRDLVGQQAQLAVDVERRAKIRVNHSATHLLHSALRKVLGEHVKQAGSRVDDRSLRFDYSHFEPVTKAQMGEIQTFVNDHIRANHPVSTCEMAIDEARKRGAMALFGEKYGDLVRVVEIGPDSLELCGGTHVSRSGDIGFLLVQGENGVAAGVRRIECVAGGSAWSEVLKEREEVSRAAELLKGDSANLAEKVGKVLDRNKDLEREIEQLKGKLAATQSGDLVSTARLSPKGVKVIAHPVEGVDADTLRSMVDTLRVKIGSGVVALGSRIGDEAVIVAGSTADLKDKVNIGSIVKEAVKESGGRGGGRSDFAQAGGVEPSKLDATLNRFFSLVG